MPEVSKTDARKLIEYTCRHHFGALIFLAFTMSTKSFDFVNLIRKLIARHSQKKNIFWKKAFLKNFIKYLGRQL